MSRPKATKPADKANGERKYDKGERRFKHVGRAAEATIDDGNPKKVVGKCPNDIADSKKVEILATAVAASTEEKNEPFPSRMFAVYEGVIYDCRTTTFGESYHAFPYHGDLSKRLHDDLEQSVDAKMNPNAFKQWVAKHVRVVG